ncbi:MAG: hypothetical protein ACLQOO_18455 [Terriglobia bacterium]
MGTQNRNPSYVCHRKSIAPGIYEVVRDELGISANVALRLGVLLHLVCRRGLGIVMSESD